MNALPRHRAACRYSAGALTLLLAAAASTTSSIPPALTLSDQLGDSVTVDSTGFLTCAGSSVTCAPATVSSGSIVWSGSLGVFTVSLAGGQSKPALAPSQLNLTLRISTGAILSGARRERIR